MSYEYLAHHGILGQKWGLRRYQNPDGSYTAEGKKRHAAEGESTGSKIKSGLRKAQHIADKATIIRSKTKIDSTDTYDKATKGPMGTNKSRRQADWEADHGINGSYSRRYNEGKKVREAEKREAEYSSSKNKKVTEKAIKNLMNKKIDGLNKKHQKELEELLKDKLNPMRNKKQPWDEKPDFRQPWDEKPDKSRKGNI